MRVVLPISLLLGLLIEVMAADHAHTAVKDMVSRVWGEIIEIKIGRGTEIGIRLGIEIETGIATVIAMGGEGRIVVIVIVVVLAMIGEEAHAGDLENKGIVATARKVGNMVVLHPKVAENS